MVNERGEEMLAECVERLEKDVEEVRDELRDVKESLDLILSGTRRGEDAGTTPASPKDHSVVRRPAAGPPSTERRDDGSVAERGFGLPLDLKDLGDLRSGEWWLNKVGIGLLLFGVAFLYLLSVERGWLSPPVRVAFGLLTGAALLTVGLRVYEDRRAFARVLLGGGVGTFYITGFAAFQLYALVPYPVAFGFMVAVTLLASFLSLRQDEASLSLIGSLGGLGTPFILYDGSGSLGGLVLYACLILAGAGTIYLYKGWVSLFGVSFAGGWMIFLNGLASNSSFWSGRSLEDELVLQLGVTFAWLLFWLAPVVREALRTRDPAAWPLPGPLARSFLGGDGSLLRNGAHAHLASIFTPLVALAFTQGIWGFQKETLALISFGCAVLYAFAAFSLRRIEVGRLAYTQALVALLLLTLSFVLALEGNALLFVLAAEAAILHYVALKLSDRLISAGAHSLFFVAAAWLGVRLASGAEEGFHIALVDLAVIALAFGASSKVVPRSTVRVYRVLAHLAALAWLARELLPLPDGDTWTLLSWALYAAGLYFLSRRLPNWGTAVGTHALSAVVAVWLGARLTGAAAPGVALFDLWGISDLALIALLALAALVVPPLPPRGSVHAYRLTGLPRMRPFWPGCGASSPRCRAATPTSPSPGASTPLRSSSSG